MIVQSVNIRVKQFKTRRIKLHTRLGQGHNNLIIDCSDEDMVRKTFESDWKSVYFAKKAWQKSFGKETNELTFRPFYPH